MSRFVSILRDLYIRFLIWLGAEPPAGYEHLLPDGSRLREYTLTEGETIFSVARKFGVHYDRIAQASGIEDPETVGAGQTVVIPPDDWDPATGPWIEAPAEDEPDTDIEPTETIPEPVEPPAGPSPPSPKPAETEQLDWLAEAEQTGQPVSETEEPTLLPPDEWEQSTELAAESGLSPEEPEWLRAAEPTTESAPADTFSTEAVEMDEENDKDLEWLIATDSLQPEPDTTIEEEEEEQPDPDQYEMSAPAQEELPFDIDRKDHPLPPPVAPQPDTDDEMIFRYEVQRGDTLSSVAKRYALTVKDLIEANDIADPSRISAGQKLIIPGYLSPKTELEHPDPALKETTPPTPGDFFVYTVAEGDTVSSIAKRYGITVRELVEVNDIEEPSRLWAGQRLYIPGLTQPSDAAPEKPAPVQEPAPATSQPATTTRQTPTFVTDPHFPPQGPLDAIRALYLSYFAVGHPDSLKRMFQLLTNTEFNAVVIDIKGEHGWISYPTQIPRAFGIETAHPTAKNFAVLMQEFKARGIYTIARIVTFKDKPLATARPELALKTTAGALWQDKDGAGWSDPFLKPVWDYNIQLAVEAAQKEFDEIQFDYLRFPSASPAGPPQFSQEVSKETRVAAISSFLSAARGQLKPFNVNLAADTFGYTCWRKDDTLIGQDIEKMAPYLDVLSPKLYPSSFGNGIPNYKLPVAHPYEVIHQSAQQAVQRVSRFSCKVRPWLQDFADYRFDGRVYGKEEIQAQIKGAFDAGGSGFMVWNPDLNYTANAYAPLRKSA